MLEVLGKLRKMKNNAITVENVSKIFETKFGHVKALEDITFNVGEGEFIAIVGPSGCGKTTLLRIIAGLIRPTKGRVIVNNEIVNKPLTNIGLVFQFPTLLPWKNVMDNILFQIEMRGLKKSDYIEKCKELIKMVGIEGFEKAYPSQLSGGMQARVALCRALIHDPPILLMDEPFRNVDAYAQDILDLELLKIWEKSRKTVIFVTHNLSEAVFLADKVIVMSYKPGRIIQTVNISLRLGRPRTLQSKATQEYGELVVHIRKLIEDSTKFELKEANVHT